MKCSTLKTSLSIASMFLFWGCAIWYLYNDYQASLSCSEILPSFEVFTHDMGDGRVCTIYYDAVDPIVSSVKCTEGEMK